ncbi:TFP11-domain-containing protein [Xylariaceae sp. FL0255]|nr:TFP11-domain-containing protein [Xylariaceae sp. FL0255]
MAFNTNSHISKADAAAYSSSEGDDDDSNDEFIQQSVDPRADEFQDFNPRKRRRTGRNAKESAALGIFASDSEEDNQRNPSMRWKSKTDLRHKNVTFVSGGQEKLDEQDDESGDDGLAPSQYLRVVDDAEDIDGDGEDEDEEMTGIGLGFRPSASSMQASGWATPSKPAPAKTKYDGSNPLGKSFVPTSAKEPTLKSRIPDQPAPETPKPSAFGAGSKAKSFAARMMARMGYVEGQGLGAEQQGRASIIEATLRPQGNVGLGAVREKSAQEIKEEKRQARLKGEDVLDSDEERKRRRRERKKKTADSGSASGTSTPRRQKTKYMTANDIRKAAPGLHIPDAFTPILDLTGRDQKLLTSGSGLLTPTTGTELIQQSEMRKLAARAQGDLAAFVEEWKTLEDKKAWLDMEAHRCQQEAEELETEFSSLHMFSSVLDEISDAARKQQWDPITSALKKAETTPSAHTDELAAIAVASIHPFLTNAVQGWQPLEDPKLGNFSSDLNDIRGVLGLKKKDASRAAVTKWDQDEIDNGRHSFARSTTPYESMIYTLLLPKLVATVSQTWTTYDASPFLAVLDKWEQLLPAFVRSHLLEQIVRRLDEAIKDWKPKKDRNTLPHMWLFPWLQHLPPHHLEPKGTGLVADVRRKFRQLIDSWEFERGVIPGLKQWKDVFRPSKAEDQWKPLVMHHILPSMGQYLRTNFRVDPTDQEPYLKMLEGVLRWIDVISSSMIAEVVVTQVFPMWHDVLYQWLISDEANYEEIGAWYEWWQNEVFPAEVSSEKSIQAEFGRGTIMIEKALELGDEAKTQLPRPDKQPARQAKPTRPKTEGKPVLAPRQPVEKAEPTFRDEVEEWCQENDLQFIPVRKANEQGKHYFRLTARMDGKGGVLAYFEGDVLMVESRKTKGPFRREAMVEWGALLDPLYEEVEKR